MTRLLASLADHYLVRLENECNLKTTTSTLRKMRTLLKTILLTGLFVGTTDLIAAYVDQFIKTGQFADRMLYYIAGGALGLETSMKGGFLIGVLGLFFHYFIATSFTALFFLVYPRLNFAAASKSMHVVIGILYGFFVGSVMTFIVLPLTPLPRGPFVFEKAIIGWCILGVVLGLPIAISARRFYNNRAYRSLR